MGEEREQGSRLNDQFNSTWVGQNPRNQILNLWRSFNVTGFWLRVTLSVFKSRKFSLDVEHLLNFICWCAGTYIGQCTSVHDTLWPGLVSDRCIAEQSASNSGSMAVLVFQCFTEKREVVRKIGLTYRRR